MSLSTTRDLTVQKQLAVDFPAPPISSLKMTSVRSAQPVLFATVSVKHSAHQVKLVARQVVLPPYNKHAPHALSVNTVKDLVRKSGTAEQALTTTNWVPRHQIPAKLVGTTFTVKKKQQQQSPSASLVVKMKTAKISQQVLSMSRTASENVPL